MSHLHWFRRGLRLHDNPALLKGIEGASRLLPVFVLDPSMCDPSVCGPLRMDFLLECLRDLHRSLEARGSRLLVVMGNPEEVLPALCTQYNINTLSFERSFRLDMETKMMDDCTAAGVETIYAEDSKTMFPMDDYIKRLPKQAQRACPMTMPSFQKLFASLGCPPEPKPAPTSLPPVGDLVDGSWTLQAVPELGSLAGYPESVERQGLTRLFPGGETEALARLAKLMKRTKWVAAFEKPHTIPNPAKNQATTTALSPYVANGSLSPRTFWHAVRRSIAEAKVTASKPPVSLHGQLLWREFYHLCGHCVGKDFDKMVPGNWMCRHIPWGGAPDAKECLTSDALTKAWAEGKTGYPWIDAAMSELRQTGWIHHLARHAVACFLTRGDLWRSWEVGQLVFHRDLVDYDWALNAGNWMWLSCSGFFYQYFRVYSPVAFAKKTDLTKNAEYIRRWVPKLETFPAKFIYEPNRCPLPLQQKAKCVIGKDYPKYVVDHKSASDENKGKMAAAYNAARDGKAATSKRLVEKVGGDESKPTKRAKTQPSIAAALTVKQKPRRR